MPIKATLAGRELFVEAKKSWGFSRPMWEAKYPTFDGKNA
jgi:hypothetical protein